MMKRLMSASFWDKALARATRTAAQSFIASVGSSAVLSDINWTLIGSTTAVAVLLSFATSILIALPEEDKEVANNGVE